MAKPRCSHIAAGGKGMTLCELANMVTVTKSWLLLHPSLSFVTWSFSLSVPRTNHVFWSLSHRHFTGSRLSVNLLFYVYREGLWKRSLEVLLCDIDFVQTWLHLLQPLLSIHIFSCCLCFSGLAVLLDMDLELLALIVLRPVKSCFSYNGLRQIEGRSLVNHGISCTQPSLSWIRFLNPCSIFSFLHQRSSVKSLRVPNTLFLHPNALVSPDVVW